MKFILSMIVILSFVSLKAQNEYTVIKVKGTLKIMPGFSLLKAGMRIKDNQTIYFDNSTCAALVVSPRKGEFVLKQKQSVTGRTIGKSIQGMVSNYLQLTKKTVATRSFIWLTNKDLKKNFGPDPIPISKDTSFVIENEKYPMNSNQYFYISYQYRTEMVNKILEYSSNKLMLSPKKLFQIDGHQIDDTETSQMRLYYYRTKTKTAEFICNPNFIFF